MLLLHMYNQFSMGIFPTGRKYKKKGKYYVKYKICFTHIPSYTDKYVEFSSFQNITEQNRRTLLSYKCTLLQQNLVSFSPFSCVSLKPQYSTDKGKPFCSPVSVKNMEIGNYSRYTDSDISLQILNEFNESSSASVPTERYNEMKILQGTQTLNTLTNSYELNYLN